ncbi:hypothetical protein BARVI_12070 [Barnesiella viscericola DSM 18177]|uniref:Uncharacterized protein n=1 Tax=Barnesiella viscericola DSM 18177 TaxID=880074 RepID=W0EXQ9_9BACT|nr:hypothetical protein BARVI_12070 [Barnesiella viscericola DSM 18177]
MQGFGEKYRKPSGTRMIFSTNPKGLALLVREEHELPLPVVMGTRLRHHFSFGSIFPTYLLNHIPIQRNLRRD